MLPLETINPPNTKTVTSAHEPNVFATIMFLPSAAMKRNNPEAIWLVQTSTRKYLKHLPIYKQLD